MLILEDGRALSLTITKAISLKSGKSWEAGTKCTVYPHPDKPWAALVRLPGMDKEASMGYESLGVCTDLETPSMDQLQEYAFDSMCETVIGTTIEPDGIDQNGWPSWLLAMGLI